MIKPGTTEDAVIRNRVNLPTSKSHAEIVRDLDPKIRAQAFFSARVAEAHILDRLREVSDAYSRGECGLGEARNRLKDFLRAEGYDPHQGGLRNLASTARLNLILEQNAAMTHAAAEWKRMHDPDAMKVFPYVRYHASVGSKRPRSDHQQYDGMIFDKNDPWLRTHTPPWDFGCHCELEEITAEEAGKTPDLIRPPTPAEKVTVDSKSGFSFDPAHVFEEFEFGSIHDPERRADLIDAMHDKFALMTDNEIYRSNARGYLEGRAEEMQRRVAAEMKDKVFPPDFETELPKNGPFEKAQEQARKAVAPEVMQQTDEANTRLGDGAFAPFLHYSGRPGDSENNDIRNASVDGQIQWTRIKAGARARIDALQNLLDAMPKFHGTLYRGCSFDNAPDEAQFLDDLLNHPEGLTGFVSMTPDPVVAHHYATAGKYSVVIVVVNSQNAVYFGPYSKHPEDEEALLSYKFYLKPIEKYEKDGIVYIMAEEMPR